MDPEGIDITFDKGTLWIKGEVKEEEEDKKRKFYRKARRSFYYHVTVPSDVDPKVEPEASYKNGVMKVTFAKSSEAQTKKITVKSK